MLAVAKALATTNIIFDVQLDPILHVSSQEPSTSFKPLCYKNLFLSRSLAELNLSNINFISVCLPVCLFACYVFVMEVTHLNISAKKSQIFTKLSG